MRQHMLAVALGAALACLACDGPAGEIDTLYDGQTRINAGDVFWRGYGLKTGTRVFGNWTTDGAGLTFYVLDEANHTLWENGGQFQHTGKVQGSNGQFVYRIQVGGALYYYCFDNRAGTDRVEVDILIQSQD